MPAEPLALSTVPPAVPAETDYDAICAAVTATARGRWFLDEYAKRNRNSDTAQVLAAIARMEAAVLGERALQVTQEANRQVRIELLEMARTIAQARAEVAESQPMPSPQLPAEPATAAAPDVGGAAERLRQIAWTMRACGVEVDASDQIGQIAETILSADALRSLGDQRAHRLTEALHYLEHRIDEMLDGRLAAAADAAPGPDGAAPTTTTRDHRAAVAPIAVLAVVASAPDGDAGSESPPPVAVDESAAAPTAAPTAAATELPMDDDVVLTMAGSFVEPAPPPPTGASAADPEPVPAAVLAPAPTNESVEPGSLPPADFEAQELRIERAQPELEPLVAVLQPARSVPTPEFARDALEPSLDAPPESTVSNDNNRTEAELGGLELEPPMVQPAAAAAPPVEPQQAIAEGVLDQHVLPAAPAIDASLHQAPESGADDDQPSRPSADSTPAVITIADVPEPGLLSGAEAMAAAELTVEPIVAPLRSAAAPDAVALQMDQDLDGLSETAPDSREPVSRPLEPPMHALAANEDDPADFLLVTLSGQTLPPEAPPPVFARPQVSPAQLSTALAAIETELFTAPPPPAARAPVPAPTPSAAKLPAAVGPLGALMAMSEEERIALFS